MRFGGAAGQISSLHITRLSGMGGRMAVPVRPSQTVYAQYKHISGRPASAGQNTVPLSRIQLLNSLIEGLKRIKSDPSYSPELGNVTPERADALIKNYSAEIHQALKSTPEMFGTLSGASTAGMVMNLSA